MVSVSAPRPLTVLPVLGQTHRHLGLGVRAMGHGVDLIELQARGVREQGLDAVEGGIDRAVARRVVGVHFAVDLQFDGGLGRPVGRTAQHLEADQAQAIVGPHHFVVDQGDQVVVEDLLLDVGQILEPLEGGLDGVVAQDRIPTRFSFSRKAWRPECLPNTRLDLLKPTDSGVMIS